MPDPVETQNATASGMATTGNAPPAGQHVVPVIRRDLTGQVVGAAPAVRADDGCSHVNSRTHTPGTSLCAPQRISDPSSVAPVIIAIVCGILILCGALTFTERGPGKLIRPKPRRRGATQRARRWRRRVGIALVVVGVVGLARTFL